MTKARIGLIHYTYPPVVGGVEIVVQQQARLFAQNSYEISVFAGEGIAEDKNIDLQIIPELKSLGVINPSLRKEILENQSFPQEFYQFSESIYKKVIPLFNNTDVFIVHNVLTNTFNPCLNHALIKYFQENPHKKCIVWTHDIVLDKKREKLTFLNPKLNDLLYKPVKNASYVVISDHIKTTLIKDFVFLPENITVISNGIDIKSFLDVDQSLLEAIIDKYDLFNIDLLILLPTKIVKHKNIDLCIKILFELKKRIKKPLMIITGKKFPHTAKQDGYQEKIYSLIDKLKLKENIIILRDEKDSEGHKHDFEIIKELYRLSDIVFFLSSYENFGLPLLEAGITKTPILCSNLKVFQEIEPENIETVDINEQTPSQIAERVLRITQANKQNSFFRTIKQKYSLEEIFSNKTLPFINKVFSSR